MEVLKLGHWIHAVNCALLVMLSVACVISPSLTANANPLLDLPYLPTDDDEPIPPGEPKDPVEVTGYPIDPPSRHGFLDPWTKPPFDNYGFDRGSGGRFNDNRGDRDDVTDAA